MKVLFITFDNKDGFTGGNVGSKRNLDSVQDTFGQDNVIVYKICRKVSDKKFAKIKNLFQDICNFSFAGLDRIQKKEIYFLISNNSHINIVFLDSSLLGILSRSLRKRFKGIKIVTFFHNIEYRFFKQEIVLNKKIFLSYRVFFAYINELIACKNSNKIICLNQRDCDFIYKYYKRYPDAQIPVSMKDRFILPDYEHKDEIGNKKVALFVGSFFFPNIHGIKWFIENILPEVDIQLFIVGNGMNKISEYVKINNKVLIFDNVPDLAPFYNKAHFMVLPIFKGAGMKIKTAEALMYGKYILATDEAFTGYEISEEVGQRCNNAPDFIYAINNLKTQSTFNVASRELFLRKYVYHSTLALFKKALI